MERKTVIGLAAVAAVAVLLYLRKRGADAATAGTGGVLTSNAAALNAAMGNVPAGLKPVTINVTPKPTVVDSVARAPAPAPAPVAAPASAYTVTPAKPPEPAAYSTGWGAMFAPPEVKERLREQWRQEAAASKDPNVVGPV